MYSKRADVIGGFRFDQASGTESSEDLYLLSHPGYCLVDEEYKDLGLNERDHAIYTRDFFNEVMKKVDEDVNLSVLEERGTDYTRDFLGDLEKEIDHFFETVEGKARPTRESADEFIDLLQGLGDGSEVVVSGEVNGLCVGQAGQIVEYVSDAYDLDLDINRGTSFPEDPVERPDGELRYV